MSSFTAKQRERMIAQWNLYRTQGDTPPNPVVPRPRPRPSPSPNTTFIPAVSTRSVKVTVSHDWFPEEVGWSLSLGETVLYRQATGSYSKFEGTVTRTFNNLSPGVYSFQITDSGRDGLCCRWGKGGFRITSGSKVLARGGSFKQSTRRKFKIG
jgi:hypothetical protein